MNKKENNNFDEDNISKEIYIEKISEDRKRLAKTFRKSTKEEFNKTYNDFLMSWKTEGYSTDNFISIKEIDDSEKIEALRDPLIVFFKMCIEDPELINNLVEILKRGGKVNSNDKPQSIQNFSLLSILFYKDLTDEQRIIHMVKRQLKMKRMRN